jgi:hypothetical protein
MYQENHVKKGSHLIEPRTYYKKANATNNGLFYSQLKMLLCNKAMSI